MIGNISKKKVDMAVANSIKETLAETKKVAEDIYLAAEKQAYIGTNGNWYVWDAEAGAFVDSGTAAQGEKGETGADGHTPIKGVDYWTDEDKAEIKAYVDEAILGGEW